MSGLPDVAGDGGLLELDGGAAEPLRGLERVAEVRTRRRLRPPAQALGEEGQVLALLASHRGGQLEQRALEPAGLQRIAVEGLLYLLEGQEEAQDLHVG